MIRRLIQDFADKNFGPDYSPVSHGKTQEIKPLVLLVRKKKPFLELPFKNFKYTTLGRMDRYLLKADKQTFQDFLNGEIIVKEDLSLKMDNDEQQGALKSTEVGVDAANFVSAKIRISKERGFLVLGKMDQEYVNDLELRDMLTSVKLDSRKTGVLKEGELRLITSVIYSDSFQHKGPSQKETEVDASVKLPSHPYAQLGGHYKRKVVPLSAPIRNTRAPFLFQCCRMVFNEEANQLEVAKGEVIGKEVDVYRDVEGYDDEDEEYKNTALEDTEEDLTDWFTDEDAAKLQAIKESVLVPIKDREERQARINKYLSWFQEALTSNQKKIFPAEGLCDADREFLRDIFVPVTPDQSLVDLSSLTDEDIKGFGIVLKIIADIPDANWDEIEKSWDSTGK